eukprot:6117074-Alexandrium_andersonii.AAC.1
MPFAGRPFALSDIADGRAGLAAVGPRATTPAGSATPAGRRSPSQSPRERTAVSPPSPTPTGAAADQSPGAARGRAAEPRHDC